MIPNLPLTESCRFSTPENLNPSDSVAVPHNATAKRQRGKKDISGNLQVTIGGRNPYPSVGVETCNGVGWWWCGGSASREEDERSNKKRKDEGQIYPT
jgi:hypothetical protein